MCLQGWLATCSIHAAGSPMYGWILAHTTAHLYQLHTSSKLPHSSCLTKSWMFPGECSDKYKCHFQNSSFISSPMKLRVPSISGRLIATCQTVSRLLETPCMSWKILIANHIITNINPDPIITNKAPPLSISHSTPICRRPCCTATFILTGDFLVSPLWSQ